MSRFERKCFVASATFHGLLLVVFVFGSAFLSNDKLTRDMGPVVTLENINVTDGQTKGGGNPNAAQSPAPPPPARPEPPPPEPVKAEPRRESPKVEPVKEPPVKVVKPKDTPKETTTPVKSSLTQKVIKRNDEAFIAEQRALAEKAAKEADRKRREENARLNAERQRVANDVNNALSNTRSGLGKSSVVDTPGPGGAAFVNYGSLVGEIYKRAVYASQPQSDDNAEAVIKIVVARDGSIRSSQWVRRTGSSVLDKAVDRAMNSVRSLPQFPPEARDSERTFNITIAFDPKRASA
jgi:TonB family protein